MKSHARLVPVVVLAGIIAVAEPRSAVAQVADTAEIGAVTALTTALSAGDAGVLTGRVTVRPRRTVTPPTVDGLLDDAVWGNAARITEFVQRQPIDGAPATEDTEVYVAYDDVNLYLAFHAKYDNPQAMRTTTTTGSTSSSTTR